MSRKLLLADDSVVIQKLVGLSFANENVEIISTDNGDDAVTRAREVVPDVVLADVVMPGKSGYEVCEAIRADAALAHIPVLLLTGTFEAFDEDRAASAGANGQITKPFEAQALVARVNEVIESAGQNAASAPSPTQSAPVAAAAGAAPVAAASESDFFDENVGSLSSDSQQAPTPDLGPSRDELGADLSGPFETDLDTDLGGDFDTAFGAPLDATDPLTEAGDLISPDADGPLAPISDSALAGDFDAASPEPLATPEPPAPAEPLAPSAYGPGSDAYGFDSQPNVELQPDPPAFDTASAATPPPLANTAPAPNATPPTPNATPPAPHATPPALPTTPPPLSDTPPSIESPQALTETPPALPDMPPALTESPQAPNASPQALTEAPPALAGEGLYASAEQVDSALASGSGDAATILVADNDANAMTSRGTAASDPSASAGGEDVTMFTPQASVDQDSMTVITPAAPFSASERGGPGVADLDAQLADSTAGIGGAAAPGGQSGENDALDLGPANVAGDDLDFSFDVSEQAPVESLSDPLGHSYSSLTDISESQVLSDPSADLPIADAGADTNGTTGHRASDYDVSLREVSPNEPGVDESADRMLPPSHAGSAEPAEVFTRPAASSAARATSTQGVSDADADLISVDEAYSATAEEPVATPARFEIPDDAPSIDADLDPDELSRGFAAIESDGRDALGAAGAAFAVASAADDSGREVAGLADDDLGHVSEDLVSTPEARSRDAQVPDLSPMMEQRIQETLEKVAWEAFSDLSESIVKQVMDRVEKIAWEVVPQMAETLVREEIRQMKGEDD